MMNRISLLCYAAAATTAIAGILHLLIVPNALGFSINNAVFFLVAGIAQLFWVVPMIRRWGTPWYVVGIAGTGVLIALYTITRIPGNPVTGRGGPVNEMAIAIEALQLAFIGLAAAVIVMEKRIKRQDKKTVNETRRL
jgi:hypothetical protein